MKLIIRDAASREVFIVRNYTGWYDSVPRPVAGDHIMLNGNEWVVSCVYIEYGHEVPRTTVTVDVTALGL